MEAVRSETGASAQGKRPWVMLGGTSTWVSGQRHLLCGHSWLCKIKNHTALAGRLFPGALVVSASRSHPQCLRTHPRHWGYRGRTANPPSVDPGRREGGRISRLHFHQGKAEVSLPRRKAKSSATIKAGMCHHRPIQPRAHPRYRRLAWAPK